MFSEAVLEEISGRTSAGDQEEGDPEIAAHYAPSVRNLRRILKNTASNAVA